MLLSVLSALVRLDVDPWDEAAKLARLPGEIATQRLAALLAKLPDRPSAPQDLGTIAAHLIALLPRPTAPKIPTMPSREKLLGVGTTINFRTLTYVLLIALLLGVLWITANR